MVKRGSIWKVNLGWAIIVAAGIGSFVLARNSITKDRQSQMRKQKALIDEVKQQIEFEKK
jgi:hypothetical protein